MHLSRATITFALVATVTAMPVMEMTEKQQTQPRNHIEVLAQEHPSKLDESLTVELGREKYGQTAQTAQTTWHALPVEADGAILPSGDSTIVNFKRQTFQHPDAIGFMNRPISPQGDLFEEVNPQHQLTPLERRWFWNKDEHQGGMAATYELEMGSPTLQGRAAPSGMAAASQLQFTSPQMFTMNGGGTGTKEDPIVVSHWETPFGDAMNNEFSNEGDFLQLTPEVGIFDKGGLQQNTNGCPSSGSGCTTQSGKRSTRSPFRPETEMERPFFTGFTKQSLSLLPRPNQLQASQSQPMLGAGNMLTLEDQMDTAKQASYTKLQSRMIQPLTNVKDMAYLEGELVGKQLTGCLVTAREGNKIFMQC